MTNAGVLRHLLRETSWFYSLLQDTVFPSMVFFSKKPLPRRNCTLLLLSLAWVSGAVVVSWWAWEGRRVVTFLFCRRTHPTWGVTVRQKDVKRFCDQLGSAFWLLGLKTLWKLLSLASFPCRYDPEAVVYFPEHKEFKFFKIFSFCSISSHQGYAGTTYKHSRE